MIYEIEPAWGSISRYSEQIGTIFQAMARVEAACMGFLGLTNVPELPPKKLSDPFPTVTRWIEAWSLRDLGFPDLTAHQGPIRFHEPIIKIFIACDSFAQTERGNLQEQFQWVPLAYDDTYARNRTLDGTVYRAGLQSPVQWATAQRYGGDWYTGWLLTAHLKLRYVLGAS
jgi:hypothetical protein